MMKRVVSNSYISGLIVKEVCGDLNEDEKDFLTEWLATNPQNKSIYQKIKRQSNFQEWNDRFVKIDEKAAWNKINVHKKSDPLIRRINTGLFKYAAIFILLISISSVFFWLNFNHFESGQALLLKYSNPTLILENGDVIDLTQDVKDEDSKLNFINYQDQHRLVYTDFKSLFRVKHKLVVPHGKEYWIQMADSSIVHLNSESVLTFQPNSYGKKRSTKLLGEGFFKVSKNLKRPFEVMVKDQTVEVLGTSFNIKAYGGNDEIITTLVTGKVKITDEKSNYNPVFLNPGQQSNWSGSELVVSNVKTSLYTSWTEGYLIFRGERIEDIMLSLSRWYDIDVTFLSNDIKEIKFGGRLYRKDSIETSLKLIENMNNIKIQRDGKKIIFSK